MNDYLNASATRHILVFIAIIIISLSLFELFAYLENRGDDAMPVPPDTQFAEPASAETAD